MSVSFFLCRVVVIPWHNYVLTSAVLGGAAVPLVLKIYMEVNFVAFDVLNCFWFYKMLKGGYRLFFGKKRNTK